MTTPTILLTVFTKDGGILTKRLSIDAADGTLVSDKSACKMVSGSAERVTVDGVAGLGALIEGLDETQAIALGGLRADLPRPDRGHHQEAATQRHGAAAPDRPHQRQYRL